MLALLLAVVAVVPAQADPGFIIAEIKVGPAKLVNVGTTTCVGGYQTRTDRPGFCSPETKRVLVRGMVIEWTYTYADVTSTHPEMFVGKQVVVRNANTDVKRIGQEWGTFVWTRADGLGEWEGTFNNIKFGREGNSWQAVGHGSGELDGLNMKGEGLAMPGTPANFIARVQGNGKK